MRFTHCLLAILCTASLCVSGCFAESSGSDSLDLPAVGAQAEEKILTQAVARGSEIALTKEQTRGLAIYERWCTACHGQGVRSHPGTGALAIKYQGSDIPAALADRTDLTPELIEHFVRNGISVMPFFRITEITHRDLDHLSDYLTRNSARQQGVTP